MEFYESMFRENQNDPTIQLSLADRYAELGRLQSEIGTLEQAMGPLEKGRKMLERLVEQGPWKPGLPIPARGRRVSDRLLLLGPQEG